MFETHKEISGNETHQGDGSVIDALVDFYKAFNERNLDSLKRNWAEGDLPSMNNPIGGTRRGWDAISEGYSKLFDGPASVQVKFYDFTSQGGHDWHLFVGREKGWCKTPHRELEIRFRTTRWFVKIDENWRQLHHHGSIEAPALLADYQRMVLGAPVEPLLWP